MYLYVSPHLDDVVLSAGGLVRAQVHAGHRVVIATLCSADPPHQANLGGLAAELHATWGGRAYETRRREDTEACALLGAEPQHLGLLDAIYRAAPSGDHYQSFESLFGPIPEWDLGFATAVDAALLELVARTEPAAIFGPLAVGHHVDHRHTLEGLARLHPELRVPLALYEDQPYAAGLYPARPQQSPVNVARLGCPLDLHPETHAIDLAAKRSAILCYRSQLSELFGEVHSGLDALEAYSRTLASAHEPAERVWVTAGAGDPGAAR